MNREKEIKHLIYLKSELIKATKKEIKKLQEEQNMIYGYKNIEKGYSKKLKYGKN